MSELELRHIRKSPGTTHVIYGVDLKVERGEFVVFVARQAALATIRLGEVIVSEGTTV